MTNDYKWLRILKKFLRSYVYEWRGTPMLCPKSPHPLCRRAVGAVGAVTAVNASTATTASTTSKTICDMRYGSQCIVIVFVVPLSLSLNVSIQKLKVFHKFRKFHKFHKFHVEQLPCALKMDYKSTLESVTSCNCKTL